MPVCLHCGELSADGALFCTKCGYTLPQTDGAVPPPPPPPRVPAPPAVVPVPVASPMGVPVPGAPAAFALPPGTIGATPAIPPPPAGKYCIRCRTVISRAAVYCPVCQQPQV